MDGETTLRLQSLLDRMNAGDPTARRELIGRAYDRLRLLAAHPQPLLPARIGTISTASCTTRAFASCRHWSQ
jgi:hypothetical protein